MNIVLWIVQVLLAAAFLMAGFMKVFRYEQARQSMAWVSALPRGLVTFIGSVEMLGALGLLLPAFTGLLPWLTPLAAVGLMLNMLLAGGFHLARGEYQSILANLVLLALAALVTYGRFVVMPL